MSAHITLRTQITTTTRQERQRGWCQWRVLLKNPRAESRFKWERRMLRTETGRAWKSWHIRMTGSKVRRRGAALDYYLFERLLLALQTTTRSSDYYSLYSLDRRPTNVRKSRETLPKFPAAARPLAHSDDGLQGAKSASEREIEQNRQTFGRSGVEDAVRAEGRSVTSPLSPPVGDRAQRGARR